MGVVEGRCGEGERVCGWFGVPETVVTGWRLGLGGVTGVRTHDGAPPAWGG